MKPNSNEEDSQQLPFKDLIRFSDIAGEEEDQATFATVDVPQGWAQRVAQRIVRASVRYGGGLGFLREASSYFYQRGRVIFVLSGVLGELVNIQLEVVKRRFISKMFWGRSKVFRYLLQTFIICIVMGLVISRSYRTDVITDLAYGGALDDGSFRTDLIVQNGSSQTFEQEDRGRYETEIYTIKKGDTLASISSQYSVSVDTLKWTNDIFDETSIVPGDKLTIPPGSGVLHEVGKDDTIDSVAEEYDSSPNLIAEFNYITYPFELPVGNTIFVPDGVTETPEAPEPVYVPTPTVITARPSPTPTPAPQPPVSNVSGRFLSWPVAGGVGAVSQCYGGYHNGLDIASSALPNLVAAADGVVTFAGCQSGSCPPIGSLWGGYGLAWSVIIDHGNGYQTLYAHMQNLYVSSGDVVSRGQSIGQMGSTGTSTGPHIHFMISYTGQTFNTLNPAAFMQNSVCGY